MENNILTANEFLWNGGIITQGDTEPYGRLPNEKIPKVMIEFAKLHVQEALKYALEEVPYGGSDEVRYEDVVGILTCYPLENIK